MHQATLMKMNIDSWIDGGDLYRDKKSPRNQKLMQIDFYYDVIKNHTSDQDYADFWTIYYIMA